MRLSDGRASFHLVISNRKNLTDLTQEKQRHF